MKILLINPPYFTITSMVGVGHQVPAGLLAVAGPLLDAGHEVRLLDAESRRMRMRDIVREVQASRPELVMTGHAGSTPAHPVCIDMLRAIKAANPEIVTVYGGVFPTYHAESILSTESAVDIVVRGEGESTTAELVEMLKEHGFSARNLAQIAGIAFRHSGEIHVNGERQPIHNLDGYRVAWELIDDWSRYNCFGMGRAAVMQFSRGCPHRCTYCGQHSFWVQWRHRSVSAFVGEVERLHREHGVNFITLADENPTTLKHIWKKLLEELAARRLPVGFFATIRAQDIVRDGDILHLYRQAGLLYVLMGIESTNGEVLKQIKKGSTTKVDYQACQLLKQHGIFSIIGHIVGFADENWKTFRDAHRQLAVYDGDYLNAMYVAPHSWTAFGKEVDRQPLVEADQRKWDYRHQVLAQKHLRPWQLLLRVKWLELWFHLRPRRLWRICCDRDLNRRRQWIWTYFHIGLVWIAELAEYFRLISMSSSKERISDQIRNTERSCGDGWRLRVVTKPI